LGGGGPGTCAARSLSLPLPPFPQAFWKEGDSLWVRVAVPADLLRYIVPKGYIAVDGTSLTVCDVTWREGRPHADGAPSAGGTFTFMLIAHTQKAIIVPRKPVGGRVNIEVDVMGKYAEAAAAAAAGSAVADAVARLESKMDAIVAKMTARLDGLEAAVAGIRGGAGGSA
jgi:riboflavin synthase